MIGKSKDEQKRGGQWLVKAAASPCSSFLKTETDTKTVFTLAVFSLTPTVPTAQFECARLFAVKFFPAAEYLP
ncbi:MAG: hypothetical protein RSA17_10540 [Ruthenibacterium sp.]